MQAVSSGEDAAFVFLYLPAAQDTQASTPLFAWYVPVGHTVQFVFTDAVPTLCVNFPAGHGAQGLQLS